MARARSVSSQTIVALRENWSIYITAPGAVANPAELDRLPDAPIPATLPSTAIAAVRASRSTALDSRTADVTDIWYRCRFDALTQDSEQAPQTRLVFEGLATLATVWLNGELLLHSENMFLRHEPEITALLRSGENDLCIRFASLNHALETRRPRGRWKTHLVDHQQLRWIRTALLGRMPGWHHTAQRIHAVGPWRAISLVQDSVLRLESADIRATVDAARTGTVRANVVLHSIDGRLPVRATLHVSDNAAPLEVTQDAEGRIVLAGELCLPDVDLWWPHTHGGQALYAVSVGLEFAGDLTPLPPLPDVHTTSRGRVRSSLGDGESGAVGCGSGVVCSLAGRETRFGASDSPSPSGERTSGRGGRGVRSPITINFGPTGFRTTTLDTTDGNFRLSTNDIPIFYRGAVWTTADAESLIATPDAYDRPLTLAHDAGMNMLRLPGTGFYESDAFYDLCVENGIALWQDFAFALMDYPTDDPAFCASIDEEARQLLDRLQLNPALTLLCGNSECAATAAMHGLSETQWANPLFDEILPSISREILPDVPYVPSSEWGGALPFHVDSGPAYYYGVGAYLRPLEDTRRADVRFASECLAFANIPDDETIDRFLADGETPGNHPSWKAGVPRNVSLGWDFDNVRDHYVRTLLGEDPAAALFSDTERYLALGRAASGEAVEATFGEWRRAASPCAGALVLFFQDIWPGAGWGILDSDGRPKSVYYALKRALAPLALFFTDEGMNGLRVHVINDGPKPIGATLRVALYRHGQTQLHEQRLPICVPARSAKDWSVDALIGHFTDTTYAYKFGPAAQDVTVATLESTTDDTPLTRPAFFFPAGRQFARSADLGLEATAQRRGESNVYDLTVQAKRFAQTVHLEARGFLTDDNHFHLEPGQQRRIVVTPFGSKQPKRLDWSVGALNALSRTKIDIREATP